jgi:hypothetical protein
MSSGSYPAATPPHHPIILMKPHTKAATYKATRSIGTHMNLLFSNCYDLSLLFSSINSLFTTFLHSFACNKLNILTFELMLPMYIHITTNHSKYLDLKIHSAKIFCF